MRAKPQRPPINERLTGRYLIKCEFDSSYNLFELQGFDKLASLRASHYSEVMLTRILCPYNCCGCILYGLVTSQDRGRIGGYQKGEGEILGGRKYQKLYNIHYVYFS